MSFSYAVLVRCGCRGPDGKQLGQECPKLWRKDGLWNSRHGSAGFATRIPTGTGTRLLKRFGYASKDKAEVTAQAVGKLLDLAGADAATRAKIGDMIVAAKRALPRQPPKTWHAALGSVSTSPVRATLSARRGRRGSRARSA